MRPLTEKQKAWQAHLSAWQKSGLAQSDYCKQHQLDLRQFYSWKNHHKSKLESRINKSPVSSATFLPLTILPDEKTPLSDSVSVRVNDAEIMLTASTDETLFIKAVTLLRSSQ